MSRNRSQIKAPTNKFNLGNVSIVSMKIGKKKFEIACFPNKVQDWRSGAETDIDEVLMYSRVFENLNHGRYANKKALQKAFNITDQLEICSRILSEGKLQVSPSERKRILTEKSRDITLFISQSCVHTETLKPLTPQYVETLLKKSHFSVNPNHPPKKQALAAIRMLSESFPITRALMRLKVTFQDRDRKKVKLAISKHVLAIEKELSDRMVVVIEPKNFRELSKVVKRVTSNSGKVILIDLHTTLARNEDSEQPT